MTNIETSNRLPVLAAELDAIGLRIAEANSLATAMQAGELLKEVKEAVPHGKWMAWLRENVPHLHQRTASRYLKVTEGRGLLEANRTRVQFENLSINDALRVIPILEGGPGYKDARRERFIHELDGGNQLGNAISTAKEMHRKPRKLLPPNEAAQLEARKRIGEAFTDFLKAGGNPWADFRDDVPEDVWEAATARENEKDEAAKKARRAERKAAKATGSLVLIKGGCGDWWGTPEQAERAHRNTEAAERARHAAADAERAEWDTVSPASELDHIGDAIAGDAADAQYERDTALPDSSIIGQVAVREAEPSPKVLTPEGESASSQAPPEAAIGNTPTEAARADYEAKRLAAIEALEFSEPTGGLPIEAEGVPA